MTFLIAIDVRMGRLTRPSIMKDDILGQTIRMIIGVLHGVKVVEMVAIRQKEFQNTNQIHLSKPESIQV